jgi:hypothetical protein
VRGALPCPRLHRAAGRPRRKPGSFACHAASRALLPSAWRVWRGVACHKGVGGPQPGLWAGQASECGLFSDAVSALSHPTSFAEPAWAAFFSAAGIVCRCGV